MRRQWWALGLAAVITAGIAIGEAGEFIAKLLFVSFLANIGFDVHAKGMQKCKPSSDVQGRSECDFLLINFQFWSYTMLITANASNHFWNRDGIT